jgi:uncharacterized protein YjiK
LCSGIPQWSGWAEFFKIGAGGAEKVEPLFISKVSPSSFHLSLSSHHMSLVPCTVGVQGYNYKAAEDRFSLVAEVAPQGIPELVELMR